MQMKKMTIGLTQKQRERRTRGGVLLDHRYIFATAAAVPGCGVERSAFAR